jgi:hypothetical protein
VEGAGHKRPSKPQTVGKINRGEIVEADSRIEYGVREKGIRKKI